jgi:integrase/recombinase XerC
MLLSQAIKIFVQSKHLEKETSTVNGYEQKMLELCVFLRNPELNKVSEADILEFLTLSRETGRWKQNTLMGVSSCFRQFFEYWSVRDRDVLNPKQIPRIKKEYTVPKVADPVLVEKMIAICDPEDPYDIRNEAIIRLLRDSGMRVGELCSMDIDINVRRPILVPIDPMDRRSKKVKQYSHIIKNKKSRGRSPFRKVYWYSQTNDALKRWLKARSTIKRIRDRNALFVGVKTWKAGHRMDSYNVSLVFRRLCKRARIRNVNPHSLRHLFGNTLGYNQASAYTVADLMGHASIASSQVYTHLTNAQTSKVHAQFSRRR